MRSVPLFVLTVLAALAAGEVRSAEQPRVRALRTQRIGDSTYFQVRLQAPDDMVAARIGNNVQERALLQQPRLVPQDERTHAVYQRIEIPNNAFIGRAGTGAFPQAPPPPDPGVGGRPNPGTPAPAAPVTPVPIDGLEFVGKLQKDGKATFLLIYPTGPALDPSAAPGRATAFPSHPRKIDWAEVSVSLDFDTAKNVAVPAEARKRRPDVQMSGDDLEGLWAVAQAAYFALREARTSDFSFYGFAREATGRKYGVRAPALSTARSLGRDLVDRQLFEMTTGAAAVTESLQRRRMLDSNARDRGPRIRAISQVSGITIASHPWQKMMGKNEPRLEPLARFVPDDNYYLHFNDVTKLLDLGELLDQWGTNLIRLYEVNSRDLALKQRYERQLCLHSTGLSRLLGPTVVRGLAITGSDLYLREGSDVALLFHVRNKDLFLAAVQPFIDDARKEFGRRLRQRKQDYNKVAIESFVTPLREISLHRAVVGDVVIYANSPVGLRRILDTVGGKHKALADSLDFQYMRTVFRSGDKQEDGFLFLSDPFIRQLVGPASKIKEKRRLEALTSLAMVTNGALFAAWETAKLPADQQGLLNVSGLKQEEIYAPGGKDVAWDPDRQVALSDVYNTLQFSTPLIEIPIDRITTAEEQSYQRFRTEYMRMWQQYFDPIGMRLSLRDERVRVETYILPLIQSSTYNRLRQEIGGGTTTLAPSEIPASTLVQLKLHLNPRGGVRGDMIYGLSVLGGLISFDFLGDWFLVRLEDSPVFAEVAEMLAKSENEDDFDPRTSFELLFRVPITVGVEVRNTLALAGLLGTVRAFVMEGLPGEVTWGPLPEYKGTRIVRIGVKNGTEFSALLGEDRNRPARAFRPALFYALIDGGFYLSTQEESLRSLIDASVARREKKATPKKVETVRINSSLYLAPGAADRAGRLVRLYLEAQVNEQALANEPLLYVLYRSGRVNEKASAAAVRTAALKYFGFAPVSPDGSAYTYVAKTDEVRNERHGTAESPRFHTDLARNAPANQLLEQLRSLRADLRFREDGLHSVLTIQRKK